MRAAPKWVSEKALLLLHEESLAESGGAAGVADEGLLDSALAGPVMRRLARMGWRGTMRSWRTRGWRSWRSGRFWRSTDAAWRRVRD